MGKALIDKQLLKSTAVRQYRHNSDAHPGFVIGYDQNTIDVALDTLYEEIRRCHETLKAIEFGLKEFNMETA